LSETLGWRQYRQGSRRQHAAALGEPVQIGHVRVTAETIDGNRPS
jgi:hypothetical protein